MASSTASTPPAKTASDSRPQWLRFVLPLLVVSLVMGAIGVVGYRSLAEEIRRETHRTLAAIVEQKRQLVEDTLAEARADGELFFSSHTQFEILFGQWLSSGRRDEAALERMRLLVERPMRIRGWSGLAMLDTEGRPAFVAGEADVSQHAELIRDVLQRPRIELVDLHRNAQGMAYYGVLAPIGVVGDTALGVAYISWRADRTLYPLVESWPVPTRSAETYLVRRDGAGVRFLTPLRHQENAALSLTRPLDAVGMPAARAVQGELGILSGGSDYRGMPVLAYAATIAGTPWLMLAEIDEVEAYAGIRSMAWVTAVVMGLGLLLVYSAGYLLWRRSRQRQELARLQAQRAAEARFRVIFEQAPLGIVLLDAQSGCIAEANWRYADIVGHTPEELVGLDPLSLTHPDDIAESRDRIARLDTGKQSGYHITKRYQRPDGSVVWASLTCAPVQVEAEEAPRYIFIVEDITERREMEEQLRQAYDAAEAANAAKSEFLAHMSHEIRTPMNAVLGLAQVLEREPLAPNQREMVERIRSAGQSLLAILNDVLDLSKIEAGQLRLEFRPFDLGSLLANVDSLMGQAARAKGLTLHVDQVTPLPPGLLLGDGLRLEQVLFNLTGNAIKFTPQGSVTVSVRLRPEGDAAVRLRIDVRDTGIGIAPAVQSRLFMPFTQADAGIARSFGGTGLGLSICKRLVEMMGGEIGVESTPGEGSNFWFELPLQRVAGDAPPVVAARPKPSGPRLKGAHLLVVDDSAMNRDLVARALALEGATATLAADGQQAVQLLRTDAERYDAVLMDVQMPVLDGLAATRMIRGELGLIDLPVIAFTAGVREEQQIAARAAGANDVLAKPMDLDEMAELLAGWVRPRAEVVAEAAPVSAASADAATPPAPVAPAVSVPRPSVVVADAVDDDAFPLIAGIDRERVKQRLGGDRAMFLSLLEMFVEDNADAAGLAQRELAAGERDQAARRMHTLASNAGFLCALELMEAARALEGAIDRGETALDAQFAAVARQIAELVEASAPWR